MRRVLSVAILTLFAVLMLLPTAGTAASPKVYEFRIDDFNEPIGTMHYQLAKRVFDEAEADPDAVAVAIVLNTPGGYLIPTYKIRDLMMNSRMPTIAFVEGRALSAGALIGTAAEKLYMYPGSSIGAAEPRNAATNETDPKTVSAVAAEFEATAIERNRDPELAQAMVDSSVRGYLLTLTHREAVDKNYADGLASSLGEALALAGIENAVVVPFEMTTSERLGKILTIPWVAILLLVTGVIAIGLEFMKPGIAIPGLVGIVSLGLFFMGNVLVGTAGWVELGLALIGVLLLIVEVFVPGFGIFGAVGALCVGASIFLAIPDERNALTYLFFTGIAFTIALFMVIGTISKRGLGKALTLSDRGDDWHTHREALRQLVGKEGRTLTVLRPAGTALFGDEKVDVVAEGDFVGLDVPVKVTRVEGTRVVVRPVKEKLED